MISRQATLILAAALFLAAAIGSATAQLKSGDNYWLSTGCNNILGLTASLHVTQDMVAVVTPAGGGTGTPNGGFSMQLQANPNPPGGEVWAMQYGIIIEGSQALGFTEYWDEKGQGYVNSGPQPIIRNLPSNTIPSGWVLTIQLTNDSNGKVNGINFSVTDNAGNTSTLPMPLPFWINNTNNPSLDGKPVLQPIQAFQIDIVGPINNAGSTFSSGEGYITYTASNGPLGVATCPAGWGTLETSNAFYGMMTSSGNYTLTQPFAAPSSGALVSSVDSTYDEVRLYSLNMGNQDNLNVAESVFRQGIWSPGNTSNAPLATLDSSLVTFDDPLVRSAETFYLATAPNGNQEIVELSGANNTSQILPGAPAVGSCLTGFVDTNTNPNIANLFYQGTDGRIHRLTSTAGSWSEDTALPQNAPAAVSGTACLGHLKGGGDEVFYIGTDHHIYELWRWSINFDGWHTTDVTMANGAKPLAAFGSPLAGFSDTVAGTDAVFYLGTEQPNPNVYELLFSPSAIWSSVNVTGKSGAPLAAPGSTLAAHLNTAVNSEEVFYVTENGALQELWSWSTAVPSWNTEALPTAVAPLTGAALATDMDLTTIPIRDEVYYMGTDSAVHEMWWTTNSGGWQPATP